MQKQNPTINMISYKILNKIKGQNSSKTNPSNRKCDAKHCCNCRNLGFNSISSLMLKLVYIQIILYITPCAIDISCKCTDNIGRVHLRMITMQLLNKLFFYYK